MIYKPPLNAWIIIKILTTTDVVLIITFVHHSMAAKSGKLKNNVMMETLYLLIDVISTNGSALQIVLNVKVIPAGNA